MRGRTDHVVVGIIFVAHAGLNLVRISWHWVPSHCGKLNLVFPEPRSPPLAVGRVGADPRRGTG